MRKIAFLAAALALATPALAQDAPDPARLAAAKAMVDAAMPPAQRETMIRGMVTPMMANMRGGLMQSPAFAGLFAKDPRAQEIFTRFLDRQTQEALETLHQSFPALMDAMAVSYARHFTVTQLNDVRAFYETPSGKALIAGLPEVMSDPGIGAVQRKMMADSMARMPEAMKQLSAEMQALEQNPKK